MKNGSQKKTAKLDSMSEPADLRAQIEIRAHQLWRESGSRHGEDLNHWLQAERELLSRPDETRRNA